jgi:hypothetical protein
MNSFYVANDMVVIGLLARTRYFHENFKNRPFGLKREVLFVKFCI